jgi:hypothetical protein
MVWLQSRQSIDGESLCVQTTKVMCGKLVPVIVAADRTELVPNADGLGQNFHQLFVGKSFVFFGVLDNTLFCMDGVVVASDTFGSNPLCDRFAGSTVGVFFNGTHGCVRTGYWG